MRTKITSATARTLLGLAALQFMGGVAGNTLAAEPVTYENVLQALRSGADVVAIVRLRQCVMLDGTTPGPSIEGGFRVVDFIAPRESYLAVSHSHDTLTPNGERIVEYAQYRLLPDGSAEARLSRIDFTGKPIGQMISLKCSLGDGITFAWQ